LPQSNLAKTAMSGFSFTGARLVKNLAILQIIGLSMQRKIRHVIVFLERNTFNIPFPRPRFLHEWVEYDETEVDQIVERLRDASIVISNKLPLRDETLARLPKLKLIAVAATGVDNIDLAYCKQHQIAVCNTRGYAVNSLPEHALMLMLALRRNLIAYRADVEAGRWNEAHQFCLLDHPIGDLHGAKLGIIGYGRLGKSMVRLAQAVGMEVLVAERKNAIHPREDRVKFETVLSESDVISLHCPLTEETRNLIAAPELNLMKPDAVLINTARGALIDESALVDALTNHRIAGAGIDVLPVEPPREGSPLLNLRLPNLIVTPHNAWASRQAMQKLAGQLIDNLEAFVRGEPRNLVL
jgi:glycerate dehydrogenase